MVEELKTTEEGLKEELKALKDAISGKDSMIAELNKQIAIVEAHTEDVVEENIKLKESINTAIKPVLKAWMDINS
jgi:chromosome segregation ATPase